MASTYNYQTGKVTFDFVLLKEDKACRREGFPPMRIGGGHCTRCQSYKGSRMGFVACGHHTKDDEGAQEVYHQLREELKYEALCAMCY